MAQDKSQSFPTLTKPPIVEVVCGVVFEPIPGLDALVLGVYWDSRSTDFPKHQLQIALSDEPEFAIGTYPMRAFLASADNQFVLQLQHDRFFMNWRSTASAYPRFSENHGPDGLLVRAMAEYNRFVSFIENRFGIVPKVQRVELTKVDILRKGTHWSDLDELAELVPATGVFREIQRSASREVNLRYVERGDDGTAIVSVATDAKNNAASAVRIEARCVVPPTPDLQTAFTKANIVLNDVFFKLVPDAVTRFGKGKSHDEQQQ